jgi:integral membrane protein
LSGAAGRLTSSGVDGALIRYRVMSFVVGVMLLVLCVVALPLQYVWNRPALANAGFPLHGFLYIIYLLTVADLARRARFGMVQLIGLVCAGFLPGLAFYVENRTTKRFRAEQSAEIPGSDA